MKIGELAAMADTTVESIRFYEREKLLPAPRRTSSNYRIYGPEHAERLAFIRRCRTLDMALDEIRALLRFRDAPDDNCTNVNNLLDEHIEHVAVRIRELKDLQRQLRELREQCDAIQPAASCGILRKLATAPAVERERPSAAHVRGTHK